MKKRLPWFLLLFSLCFNVFFAFGYLQARRTPELMTSPEDRCRTICARLGLNEEQSAKYFKLDSLRRSRLVELRKTYSREYDEYWSEVLKDKPDRSRIEAIQDKGTLLRIQRRKVRTDFLIAALRIMTPEQRTVYARLLRGRKTREK